MRVFKVTLVVAVHTNITEPHVSAVDLVEQALDYSPELQVLEACEHEQTFVDKAVWEDIQQTTLFEDGIYVGEDDIGYGDSWHFTPVDRIPVERVPANTPPNNINSEEREYAVNDHIESQGDEIIDRETRPN